MSVTANMAKIPYFHVVLDIFISMEKDNYNKRSNVLQHNIKTQSGNHCCREKGITIKHSECMWGLSYPAYKVHAPCYTVTFVLSGSTMFSHIIL
jgi:hypothetical protein